MRQDIESSVAARVTLRRRLEARHVLMGLTILVLVAGWQHTWPDLNRDFNHFHGWNGSWHAQQAEMAASIGPWHVGFVPAFEQFYDTGHHMWFITRYPPLINLVLYPFGLLVPLGVQHLVYRLLGMAFTVAFLVFLYLTARRLRGPSFAAWALFFGAISAEVFYFGVFSGFDYTGAVTLMAGAYWAYVGWRSRASGWPWLAIAFLLASNLWAWNAIFAALPLIIDLAWFDPAGVGRRRWRQIGALAALPVVVNIGTEIYYRVVLPMVVSPPIFAFSRNFRQTLTERGNYPLLVSIDFYWHLVGSTIAYVGPVGVLVVGLFLIRALRRRKGTIARARRNTSWEFAFVASLVLAQLAFLLAFPQSTLVHQYTYFQMGIPLALAAAWLVWERGWTVKAVAIAVTVPVAFASTAWFLAQDNSPTWEFQSSIAIRLGTPQGSFVRTWGVPWNLDTPMMLYYSQRPILFDLPPGLQTAVPAPRFEEVFGASAIPDAYGSIFVQAANGIVLDHAPGSRVSLPPVSRKYGDGALALARAGITGSYENWRLVEIDWIASRPTHQPLGVEIGEYTPRGWRSLMHAGFRGNTTDTVFAHTGHGFRDGWLVQVSDGTRVMMRLYNKSSGYNVVSDEHLLDIPLEQTVVPQGGP